MADDLSLSVEFRAVVAPLMEGLATVASAMTDLASKMKALSTAGGFTQSVNAATDALQNEAKVAEQTADAVEQSEADKRKAAEMTRIAEERVIAERMNNQRKLLELGKRAAVAEAFFSTAKKKEELDPTTLHYGADLARLDEEYAQKRIQINDEYNRQLLALTAETAAKEKAIIFDASIKEAQNAQILGNKRVQIATTTAAAIAAVRKREAEAILSAVTSGVGADVVAEREAAAREAAAKEIIGIELAKETALARLAEREANMQIQLKEKIARQSGDRAQLAKLETEKVINAANGRLEVLKAEARERDSLARLKGQTPTVDINTAALEKFREESGKTFDEYIKDVKEAGKANEAFIKAGDYESAMHSLSQLGMAFTAVGAAISAGSAAVLQPIMELEKGLAAVAAVSQKPMKSPGMEALRQQAIDLSSQFLYTTGEIADGMKFLAQAGFDVPQIRAMTKDILDLATAADMPLKDAFNVAATTIRGFSMQASDMARVANVLTVTANQTNVEVKDLAESFKYAGPVAAAAGVQIEEVAAALGLMANAGIKGSMAGTALRQTISSLVAPTSNQRTMIRELGLEIQGAGGKFVGFVDIVRQLQIAFKTSVVDPAAQAGIAMKLFGDRAGPGMLAVINEGVAGLEKLKKAYGDLEGSSTAAADTAAARMDNLSDSLTKFKRAAEGLGAEVFFDLLSVMKEIVNAGTGILRWLTEFASNHPIIKNFAAGFLAVVSVLGVVLGLLGAVLTLTARFGAQLMQTQKQGMSMGAMLSLAFRGVGSSIAGATAQLNLFKAGMTAGTTATLGMRAAMMALSTVNVLAILAALAIALAPLFAYLGQKLGLLSETGKDFSTDQKASAEATNDAYKDLDKTLDSLVSKGPEFKTIADAVSALGKDASGKETAATWEQVGGALGAVSKGLTDINTQAAALLADASKTDAEYAKQAMTLMSQAEIHKEVAAAALKVAEAQKSQLQLSIAAALEEDRILGLKWRQTDAEQMRSQQLKQQITTDSERLGLLNKYISQYQKFNNDQTMSIVTQRRVVESMGDGIQTVTDKMKNLLSDYKRWKTEELDALAATNRRHERTDTWLTKEQRDQRALNREIELYSTLGSQLEAQFVDLANAALSFAKAADWKLANKSNLELIASYRDLGKEIQDLQTTTEGTANSGEADAKREIQKRKELQAVIKDIAQERVETGKKQLEILEKAEDKYAAKVKSLAEQMFQAQSNRYKKLASINNALVGGETTSALLEATDKELGDLKRKVRFEVDEDSKQKTLKDIADTAAGGAERIASKLQNIYSNLSQSQIKYLRGFSGAAGDYIRKIDDAVKEAKGKGAGGDLVDQFIALSSQLDWLQEEFKKADTALQKATENQLIAAESVLKFTREAQDGIRAELDVFSESILGSVNALDAPITKMIKSMAKFEPVTTEWKKAEDEIIKGIDRINQNHPIKPRIEIPAGLEGLPQPKPEEPVEKKVTVSTEVKPPTGPNASAVMEVATGPDIVNKDVVYSFADEISGGATQDAIDFVTGPDTVNKTVNATVAAKASGDPTLTKLVSGQPIPPPPPITVEANLTGTATKPTEAATKDAKTYKAQYERTIDGQVISVDAFSNTTAASEGGKKSGFAFKKTFHTSWNEATGKWEESPVFTQIEADAKKTGKGSGKVLMDGVEASLKDGKIVKPFGAIAKGAKTAGKDAGADLTKGITSEVENSAGKVLGELADSKQAGEVGATAGTALGKGAVDSASAELATLWTSVATNAASALEPVGTMIDSLLAKAASLGAVMSTGISDVQWASLGAEAYDAFSAPFKALGSLLQREFESLEVNIQVDARVKKRLGGIIPGYGGGDIIPAALEPGEFVVRKESVSKYGAAFFAMLNSMATPRINSADVSRMTSTPRVAFATGGLVQEPSAMGTYNLNLTVGGRTYPVQGKRAAIEGLIEQLRREELTTT